MITETVLTLWTAGAGAFGLIVGIGVATLVERRHTPPAPARSPHVADRVQRTYGPHPAPAVIGAIIDPPRVVQQARRPVPDVNKHVLDPRLWKAPVYDGRRWQAGVVHTTAVPAVDLPAVEQTP